jgi:uncharacterized protein
MTTNFFYVYAIKDPRSNQPKAFYVGKGTGSRAFDHLVSPDSTRKYRRIKEIVESGQKPIIDILVDDLNEAQALKIEAELISAFGTEETGGVLTNAVVPSGLGGKKRDHLAVPHGIVERAQLGLGFLKTAIYEFAKANSDGITNSDAKAKLNEDTIHHVMSQGSNPLLKPSTNGVSRWSPGARFAAHLAPAAQSATPLAPTQPER